MSPAKKIFDFIKMRFWPIAAVLLILGILVFVYRMPRETAVKQVLVGISNEEANLQLANSYARQVFLRKNDCDCQVRGLVIQTSDMSKAEVDLDRVLDGCSANSKELLAVEGKGGRSAKRIYIGQFEKTDGSGNDFMAKLNIVFEGKVASKLPPTSQTVFKLRTKSKGDGRRVIEECLPMPLTPPKNFEAMPAEQSCVLSWAPANGPGPLNYSVCYSKTKGEAMSRGASANCVMSSENRVEVSQLEPSTTYYFSLQVTNPTQNLPWSPEITCEPKPSKNEEPK